MGREESDFEVSGGVRLVPEDFGGGFDDTWASDPRFADFGCKRDGFGASGPMEGLGVVLPEWDPSAGALGKIPCKATPLVIDPDGKNNNTTLKLIEHSINARAISMSAPSLIFE